MLKIQGKSANNLNDLSNQQHQYEHKIQNDNHFGDVNDYDQQANHYNQQNNAHNQQITDSNFDDIF